MEVQQNRSEKTGLALVAEKLITKEDPLHVHKILGVLVLASYAWRFSLIVRDFDSDMGFKTHPEWTIPTLLLHASLNLSSFQFVIPKKRIKNGGRIWPEYRLHALVFLMRSIVIIAIKWYGQQYHLESNYTDMLRLFTVLCAMAAADFASYWVGDHHSDSIRDVEAPVFFRGFFSLGQFFATALTLVAKRCSGIFYFAFMVQITPFFMTLSRKNLMSHQVNVLLYFVGIYIGLWLGNHEGVWFEGQVRWDCTGICVIAIVAMTAAFFRMIAWPAWIGPVMSNKYMAWTAMSLLNKFVLRPILDDPLPPAAIMWDLSVLTPAKKFVYWFAHFEMFAFAFFMGCKQIRSMGGVGSCIRIASKNLNEALPTLRYVLHVSSVQRSEEMGTKSKKS